MKNTLTVNEAKSVILNYQPFLGSLLFNLPVVEDSTVPTLGVDGETLFYNPEFWDRHGRYEKCALLMHEAGHMFLRHLWRGKNFTDIAINPETGSAVSLFNIAGDYVINLMIDSLDSNKFKLPTNCLLDRKYENWTTEEVYKDLQKNMKKATKEDIKKMVEGGFCDKSRWGKKSGKEAREDEKKWSERIKQATEYAKAKQKGSEPAWLKRLFAETQPKEDWRALLRDYVQAYSGDYSFAPSDRRFSETDFIMPDIQDNLKVDYIAVAIDTSGSIGDKELNAFLGEVRGILGSYDRVSVKLTFCDADASPFVELDEFDKDKIRPTGGGGTDFAPVFELLKKEETEPKCLVYLTDGQGSFPRKAPDYDVIWISTEKSSLFPFGRVLDYKT